MGSKYYIPNAHGLGVVVVIIAVATAVVPPANPASKWNEEKYSKPFGPLLFSI